MSQCFNVAQISTITAKRIFAYHLNTITFVKFIILRQFKSMHSFPHVKSKRNQCLLVDRLPCLFRLTNFVSLYSHPKASLEQP